MPRVRPTVSLPTIKSVGCVRIDSSINNYLGGHFYILYWWSGIFMNIWKTEDWGMPGDTCMCFSNVSLQDFCLRFGCALGSGVLMGLCFWAYSLEFLWLYWPVDNQVPPLVSGELEGLLICPFFRLLESASLWGKRWVRAFGWRVLWAELSGFMPSGILRLGLSPRVGDIWWAFGIT